MTTDTKTATFPMPWRKRKKRSKVVKWIPIRCSNSNHKVGITFEGQLVFANHTIKELDNQLLLGEFGESNCVCATLLSRARRKFSIDDTLESETGRGVQYKFLFRRLKKARYGRWKSKYWDTFIKRPVQLESAFTYKTKEGSDERKVASISQSFINLFADQLSSMFPGTRFSRAALYSRRMSHYVNIEKPIADSSWSITIARLEYSPKLHGYIELIAGKRVVISTKAVNAGIDWRELYNMIELNILVGLYCNFAGKQRSKETEARQVKRRNLDILFKRVRQKLNENAMSTRFDLECYNDDEVYSMRITLSNMTDTALVYLVKNLTRKVYQETRGVCRAAKMRIDCSSRVKLDKILAKEVENLNPADLPD